MSCGSGDTEFHEYDEKSERNDGNALLGTQTGNSQWTSVAGVIGEKKFAYDVWGDTVNTASRMESSGQPGKINISGSTFQLIQDFFDCEYRGKINAKNKGEIEMYFVNGIRKELTTGGDTKTPNTEFWKCFGTVRKN